MSLNDDIDAFLFLTVPLYVIASSSFIWKICVIFAENDVEHRKLRAVVYTLGQGCGEFQSRTALLECSG